MNHKLAYALLPVIVVLFLPYIVFACSANSNVWDITILKGPLITCTGAGAVGGGHGSYGADKNCQDLCDLVCTSANVVYFTIGVVLWIIMPITVAWSGVVLVLSRGSPEKTGQARKMITGVVIGLLIVLCAYLIVYTFVKVLGISGIGGFGSSACTILQS